MEESKSDQSDKLLNIEKAKAIKNSIIIHRVCEALKSHGGSDFDQDLLQRKIR